jgi:hypothetical protein
VISHCWLCGNPTLPELPIGSSSGQHEYLCDDCDVRWVTPEYWLESKIWKDNGGFKGYKKYRLKLIEGEMKRYRLSELVDHGKLGSPGTPALGKPPGYPGGFLFFTHPLITPSFLSSSTILT